MRQLGYEGGFFHSDQVGVGGWGGGRGGGGGVLTFVRVVDAGVVLLSAH